MTSNFPASLAFVLRHECVFAPGHDGDLAYVIPENVPGDTGGCTKYGIDAADHPNLDIPSLTLDQATAIYRDAEWTLCRCDLLPIGIDTAVFDCAVNNGIHMSAILLQRSLLACGFSLTIDGLIGSQTLGQLTFACTSSKPALIENLLDLRRNLYSEIVLLHPGDSQFLDGWLNRVNDLEQFINSQHSAPLLAGSIAQ